ncbi:helix-turn-helix transcriptional regulator [Halomarina oriensis]|uniref:Uncharacterized protein n=1 Tax=Halomarina oriensis TaxID=671145 RepID=A0A6B0GHR2_9EURY|nr:helix-turn-helix transcriptional regulator [Halomarina oriensis]MWG32959.1 hypothetical protein [Halomarina oriensis]
MARDEPGADTPETDDEPSRLQYDLLVAAAELDRLNQSLTARAVWDRARRYGVRISHAALYNNLSALVETGLLSKRTNPADARSSLYEPTETGIETLRNRSTRLSSALSGALA